MSVILEPLSRPVSGVAAVDQGGLMDVAFHPAFEHNSLIYISYVEPADQQPSGLREATDARFDGNIDTAVQGGALSRTRLEGNELKDLDVLWWQQPKTLGRGHFGHRLLFGPDGKLFITSGDRMRFDPAQSLGSNLGKVVRINADGSIPADNSFVDKEDARGDSERQVRAKSGAVW